jgi:hypothetical protein
MVQPGLPVVVKPPVSRVDVGISVAVLLLTAIMGAGASVLGLFSLAFLDHCPPETCSAEGAVTAVMTALMIAFAVGLVGLVITVVQLFRRKPAWPFAVATFLVCVVVLSGGVVAYGMAVG